MTTLNEQYCIFKNLVKEKPLPAEEKGVLGARRFRRLFGGILGLRKRTEEEATELLIKIGMGPNPTKAREMLDRLERKPIAYKGVIKDCEGNFYQFPSLGHFFRLESTPTGEEKKYRLYFWNTMPSY